MKWLNFMLIAMLLIFVFGCTKKKSAGWGGNTTLVIKAQHHGATIDSGTIYIKFNATDAPSDNTYDAQQVLQLKDNGSILATFSGLKTGDYYIYGYCYDKGIANNVKGGIPYTIQQDGTIELIVPVTETH